jgi:hypothetical protein
VRKADNLLPSCAVVTKSGNLNFLEPSGPVQTFTRTYFDVFTSYSGSLFFSKIYKIKMFTYVIVKGDQNIMLSKKVVKCISLL